MARIPKLSRRALLSTLAAGAGGAVASAFYMTQVEPFWLDVHDNPVALPSWKGLGGTAGLRIAHLTDIHFDHKLPGSYAGEIARRVREEIRPDLVAFTGDLTTHSAEHLPRAADWLMSFGVPTVACLGNHDYDPKTSARAGCPLVLADDLERRVRGSGVALLRNASTVMQVRGGELQVVGVEDYYTGLLDANAAAASPSPGLPRLVLCHNPDAARFVDPIAAGGLVLAGHTHGGQIRIPGFGHVLTNVMDDTRIMGPFPLPNSTLYVSRGLGYLLQARLFCRPELPVHVVTAA